MTATYDSPAASDKDAVRFLLGDTTTDKALVEDVEIEFLLARWLPVYGTVEYVAAVAADAMAARFAREANYSADGVSISLATLSMQFRELAASLRSQHKNLLVGGLPDVGGITPGEQTDPDIAPFDFGTGMHDNHEAGRQQYGNRTYPDYIAEYMPGVMVYDPRGISTTALDYVRDRATLIMGYTCVIERVKVPSFDQTSGTASPGIKVTIYEGVCRVWELAQGAPVMVTEEDVVMQTTRLSIPWNVNPVPERNDEVQILSSDGDDDYMVGKRFVIDSSAKAGELRATRSFNVRGYQR